MKKHVVLAAMLVACLAFGLTASSVAKPKVKKVETTVTLTFTKGATYGGDVFSGQAKAKKGCKKQRKITINGTALTATTNSSGNYEIQAGTVAPGTYTATAAKKVRKKNNGTKIICKKDTSPPVVVP